MECVVDQLSLSEESFPVIRSILAFKTVRDLYLACPESIACSVRLYHYNSKGMAPKAKAKARKAAPVLTSKYAWIFP